MIERISIHIEIWEHRLGKVWNHHLALKQLEYHKTKQNKGFGLQNKPEQTYDRDFIRSFRGGAYTGSIVQHHHVQGSDMTYEASPSRHSQGLFKTLRDHYKTNRGKADH